MVDKAHVIRPDLLVLAIDTKTGRVSTHGGPFREFKFVPTSGETPKPPERPSEDPPPPVNGPGDDYFCARRTGETDQQCRWFCRVGSVIYDTGVSCAGQTVCYLLP